MDKIEKFLRKRNKKDRLLLMSAVDLITRHEISDMDIKKLKGFKSRYRVRLGKYRVIFERAGKENWIIKIDERDEQTYRF